MISTPFSSTVEIILSLTRKLQTKRDTGMALEDFIENVFILNLKISIRYSTTVIYHHGLLTGMELQR